jgi:hypothetical protein
VSEGTQESVDRFYWAQTSPCCAGCDWWRHFNPAVGECLRSAPVAGADRWAMIGITGSSLAPGAGHAVTPRDHACGEFRDSFDWCSLPLAYQHRVGARPGCLQGRRNWHV